MTNHWEPVLTKNSRRDIIRIIEQTGDNMPAISRFHGMQVYMYFNDNDRHHKPHIHVFYGDANAVVGIDGDVLEGALPNKQLRILSGWMAIHEDDLNAAWIKAAKNEDPGKIEPLR